MEGRKRGERAERERERGRERERERERERRWGEEKMMRELGERGVGSEME